MKLTKRQIKNLIRETRRELNENPLDAVDRVIGSYLNIDGVHELQSTVSSLYDDAMDYALQEEDLGIEEVSTLINMALRKVVEEALRDAKGNYR